MRFKFPLIPVLCAALAACGGGPIRPNTQEDSRVIWEDTGKAVTGTGPTTAVICDVKGGAVNGSPGTADVVPQGVSCTSPFVVTVLTVEWDLKQGDTVSVFSLSPQADDPGFADPYAVSPAFAKRYPK